MSPDASLGCLQDGVCGICRDGGVAYACGCWTARDIAPVPQACWVVVGCSGLSREASVRLHSPRGGRSQTRHSAARRTPFWQMALAGDSEHTCPGAPECLGTMGKGRAAAASPEPQYPMPAAWCGGQIQCGPLDPRLLVLISVHGPVPLKVEGARFKHAGRSCRYSAAGRALALHAADPVRSSAPYIILESTRSDP